MVVTKHKATLFFNLFLNFVIRAIVNFDAFVAPCAFQKMRVRILVQIIKRNSFVVFHFVYDVVFNKCCQRAINSGKCDALIFNRLKNHICRNWFGALCKVIVNNVSRFCVFHFYLEFVFKNLFFKKIYFYHSYIFLNKFCQGVDKLRKICIILHILLLRMIRIYIFKEKRWVI